MKNIKAKIISICAIVIIITAAGYAKKMPTAEKLKDSLVYLEISYYGYEQYQPWKNKDISTGWAVGCAVADSVVITTANSVANAAMVKAKRCGQNDYVQAEIKLIDYENDLAIIQLDEKTLTKKLVPLNFNAKYKKGAQAEFYWISSTEQSYSGKAFIDRAVVNNSPISFSYTLGFVAANTSDKTSKGQLYCCSGKPVGIANWSNNSNEAGIIPAEIINRFLDDCKGNKFKGTGCAGFAGDKLLDDALRKYLKMPEEIKNGIYITDVYTIGTGSDVLKPADVLLAIDGFEINAYGRFVHPVYDALYCNYLITGKTAGEKVDFTVFRNGEIKNLEATVKNFKAEDMLVPWYDLDAQPQYYILGGCIFQKLTRSYLAARGDDWKGKIEPHIYNYLLNEAFKPTTERKEIVLLSYVLPADLNLGYQRLGQAVVDNINGMKITAMKDIPQGLALNPDEKFDVIEFEMDEPKIVLDRKKCNASAAEIAKRYGVMKPTNIN